MPIFTYTCRDCAAKTDTLRSFAARLEESRCRDCAGIADYDGICVPAILTHRPIAAHMADGSRVVGTFKSAPNRFLQRPKV